MFTVSRPGDIRARAIWEPRPAGPGHDFGIRRSTLCCRQCQSWHGRVTRHDAMSRTSGNVYIVASAVICVLYTRPGDIRARAIWEPRPAGPGHEFGTDDSFSSWHNKVCAWWLGDHLMFTVSRPGDIRARAIWEPRPAGPGHEFGIR